MKSWKQEKSVIQDPITQRTGIIKFPPKLARRKYFIEGISQDASALLNDAHTVEVAMLGTEKIA